ncbi:peptidase M16 [Nitrospira sp.]|nr:peptidase M16 [Nitrospira sp.]
MIPRAWFFAAIHCRTWVYGTILGLWSLTAANVVGAADLQPIRFVLPNGLTVLFLEQHALPMIEAHALVKVGSAQDPPEKAGLANLVVSLLDEGTTTRTSAELAEQIEFVGGSLRASSSEDYTGATARVLKKDADLGLALLSDVLQNPVFPKHEFERVRSEIIGQLISEKDDPGTVAMRAFNQLIFAGHSYRWPVAGTEETIPQITQQDVRTFHDNYYLPNQTILSVVGDLTQEEVTAFVTKYFGGWKQVPAPTPKTASSQKLTKPTLKLINKELTQSSIILGHLGVKRSNPDYYAISVLNQILGAGGFGSRLMDNIRDKQGLAYGVMSLFEGRVAQGPFYISLQTRTEATNQAIAGVLHELKAIREAPVTDQELADAKAYLMGSFALRLDTTSKLAQTLALVELHNLGLEYFTQYPRWIERVTKEDVLRVAKRYLDPYHYALVVVGDQAKAKVKVEPTP